MRTILIAGVLTGAILAAPAATAHDDLERDLEELRDNCVACCAGARPSLRERLQLNEERCQVWCDNWIASIALELLPDE